MGKKYLLVLFTVFLTALVIPANLRAQAPGSEADVIKDAATKFENEDYAAAMPLYSQLLATHPNDPNYNYRFGVCMLFASSDKGKALPFLEEASKDPKCEIDVWFYLGRAYHLNYRFDEAIVAFNKYKTLAGEKKSEKMQVDNQIAMCKTGKKLLRAVTDITVLEKKELSVNDFFRSYNLEGYSGQLLVKGDEFKTNLDRKKNETSIIFLSSEKNTLYFSSYGDNEENGKDIYRVVRLPTGGWSKPYNVGYPINTEFDEDYPFLHPNGKVLYFCSKGHNSMGGYDIFRSELNEETGTWQKPTNMDFAINSPDDDILFVTDFEEKTAWFASARNSPQGFMTVYHVVIERKPVNMCIISGTFKPTGVDPTANAKITVRNEETNQPVGVYNSNSTTGKYLINLPNTGGKYTFTVEKSGIHTQTKTVFIPPQYEMKPIRQEIFYTETDGEQNLNVVTYFDDDTASFAPEFLMDKANLDVSPDGGTAYQVIDIGIQNNTTDPKQPGDPVEGNDTSEIPGGGTDPASNVPSSQGSVTTAELIQSAVENADATKQEAVAVQQQADRAFTYAANLDAQASTKQQEANKAKADAEAMSDGPEKTQALNDAAKIQAEANALQAQTVAAFNVANGLTEDAKQKDHEATVAKEYATALEDGSKKTGPHAMDAANAKEQELNDVSDTRSQAEETAKNLQEKADQKRENLQIVKDQLADAKEEKQANLDLIQKLKSDSANEKDADLREGYHSQIEGVQENIADNEAEIRKAQQKVDRMQNELNDLDNQSAAATAALTASKDPAVAPVPMSAEDKKKLGDNVVSYQNRVEDNSNPTVYAPVTQDPNAQNTTTQNPTTQNTVTQPIEPAADAIAAVQGDVTDKIQAAGSESDPVKKEQLIGDAHRDAEKELDAKIAAAKADLKKETDPQRKQDIQSNINQLTAEKTNQHDLALASDKRVQDEQAGVASQNPVTQPVADATADIADVKENVDQQIQAAAAESDPVKKEQLIGDAHRDAEKQLDGKIAAAKSDLKKEKNADRKKEIQANIDALTAEKNNQHDQAVASDKRLQDAQSGVATQDPSRQSDVDAAAAIAGVKEDVNEKIQAAASETDPVKKEQMVGDAHREAEQQLADKIVAAQTDLKNESEPQRKQEIQKNIDALKAEKTNQHDLAVASDKKVQDAQSGVASQNPSTQPVADAGDVIADVQGDVSDKLQQAENETDPAKKEELIGDAHRDAEQALTEKIAVAQNDLQKETDPQRKEAIQKNIDQFTEEKNNQHELAVASDKRAADSQSGVAVEQPEDPFTSYITGIADADTIADPVAKQHTKAVVYTDWASKLDDKIESDKKLLSATKDKSEKDSLKQLIAVEQQQSTDLKQNAKQAKAAEQNAIAQQNSPGAKSERAYEEQLTAVNGNPDVAQREDAKEVLYTNWADSLDNEADKLDALAVKERNSTKKASITEQAQSLREEAQDKRELAEASHTAADNARNANTVAQNPVSQDPNSQNATTQQPLTQNAQSENAVVEEGVAFTNPVAKQSLTERDALQSQAQTYREKQDSLITAAGQASGEDKTELLADASEAQRQAWAKDAEASEKQGAANNTQFNTNAAVIDSYQKGAVGVSNDKVEQAGLVNDEALVLLKKANDKRAEAKLAASPYQRKQALDEAEELEQKALVKQQEAIKLYQESGVQPTAIAQDPNARVGDPNSQNPVNQNPNSQNPNSQNPVNQNPNSQNPVTQNPVNQNPNSQNPNSQNPVTQNPNSQNPNSQNPVTQNPVNQNPNSQNPVTQNPVNQNPNSQNPNSQNPVTQNPLNQNPNSQNPVTQNPVNQNPNSQNPVTQTPADPNNQSRVATQLKPGETFKITAQPNTQPIPVDAPVPSGIVYKVQVGAFRNPIPVDQFKGIQPLTAESVGNGITRYTAGLFTDFANADAAKREIRAMGYSDAFVVAYRDGKRISVAEARGAQPNAVIPSVVEGTQQPNTQQPNTQQPNTQPNTQQPVVQQPTYQNQAPAVDVSTTKELFYTVQVGVYSRPVSSAKLYNLTGLFSEKTPNGYIRYAAGKYNNVNAAIAAKENIVNIGIKDAFVTAYFEGQRITLDRAAELERSGVVPAGSGAANAQQSQTQTPAQPQQSQAPTWEPETQQPVTQPVTQPVQQPVVNPNGVAGQPTQPTQPVSQQPQDMTPIPVIANTKPNIPDTGLVFCVQLGAYQQFVPIAMANRFLLFASKGVSIYRDANSGLTVYQVGTFGNYKDAAVLKDDAIAKGINDAFIVAWYNGEKISMEEAMKMRPSGN